MKYADDSLEWHDENELVRRLDVVEAVLNMADTLDDVVDVIMSVPTYKSDRKTENSSEKPNNSTISKMEQVETMSCEECKHYGTHHPCELDFKACRYEPKDEPQTDCSWR